MIKSIHEIREVLSLQKQSLCEIYQITEIGIFGSYPHSAGNFRQKIISVTRWTKEL